MRTSDEAFQVTLILQRLLTDPGNELIRSDLEQIKTNVSVIVSELLELEEKVERIDPEKDYKLNGKVAGPGRTVTW